MKSHDNYIETQEKIDKKVKTVLSELTGEQLREAIKEAKLSYRFNNHHIGGNGADLMSLGCTFFYRCAKSWVSLPSLEKIDNANAMQVLRIFLAGEGGEDSSSLKFHVLHHLMKIQPTSDNLTRYLISSMLTQLHYLAKVSPKKLEELDKQSHRFHPL